MSTVVFDIETDGLLMDVTKIWCIGLKVDSKPVKVFSDSRLPSSNGSIKDALSILQEADTLIGHNTIGYDIPVIQKLYDIDLSTKKQVDTILLSKMILQDIFSYDLVNPNIPKSHWGKYSLEAFGYRMGEHKGSYSDWSKLTENMLVYCKQDVAVTYKLLTFLQDQPNYPPEKAIDLENQVKRLTTLQELYGFPLDIPKAKKLRDELLLEQFSINRELQKVFTPIFLPKEEIEAPKKVINRKLYIPNENYINLLGS